MGKRMAVCEAYSILGLKINNAIMDNHVAPRYLIKKDRNNNNEIQAP